MDQHRTRHLTRAMTPVLAILLVTACSGGAASGAGGTAGSGGEGAGGAGGAGGTTGAGGFEGCPSNILCGAQGVCCDSGQECVDGACAASCDSGVRCPGGACCGAGQVCLADACASPGAACGDSFDCAESEFCEPTLGKCLPQPQGAEACQYKPGVLPFEPILEWSWTGSPILPTHNQIQSLPLVADLDGDASPDVLVATFPLSLGPAYLRLLNGKDGTEKWPASAEVYLPENTVCPAASQAIADLDSDGSLEIVAITYDNGLMAVGPDGSILWKATMPDGVTPYKGDTLFYSCNLLGAVSVAHMDGDDQAEIVFGGTVFDAKGKLIAGQAFGLAGANGLYGPISIVADADGDGTQDVVTGNAAYRIDGSVMWFNGMSDGFAAIADLDGDGAPEMIVTSTGTVRVQDLATGTVLAELAIPGGGASGGPPTVADFDGDGVMDFAAAGANLYSAFSFSSSPAPVITVKWSTATYDVSPGTTGSSVFDFDGDEAAEVVYNDERRLLILDGKDGSIRFETPSSSFTGTEYPVVVDVDGDNNSELITISADYGPPPTRHGVFVYGDANDKWVRTRRIWNQHSYHITNVSADGSLPLPEPASWAPGSPNNYRVSAQGTGVYNAPDLQVDIEASTAACPDALILRARVENAGSLGVPAGVKVRFYLGDSTAGTLLSEKETQGALLPGQSEVVEITHPVAEAGAALSFHVVVEGALANGAVIDECNAGNNDASAGGLECPIAK